ncbi:DEAD/DEAH box helicase family protein [Candidatus Gracilibacteria bacterium]|nr:DEAD/DEAH box helicase family protein [Candidatus Gracilibacteria bacterium]
MNSYRSDLSDFLAGNSEKLFMPGGKEIIFDPHQSETLEDISEILGGDKDSCSVVHGGGSGKTIIAAAMLQASKTVKESIYGSDLDRKDIVLVTERAILNSVHEKLQDYGFDVGIWGAGGKTLDRGVIIGNIPSLQRADDISKELPVDRTDLLIGDEADLYLTDNRKQVVGSFPNAFKVGLTATPEWNDKRHVSDLWGTVVNHFPMWKSLEAGISVPPLYKLFQSQNEGSGIGLSYGNYNQRSLEKAFIEAEIDRAIPQIYSSIVPEGKEKEYPTLVYVPGVDLVHSTLAELRKTFSNRGLTIEAWTGDMTTNDDIVRDSLKMQGGKLNILVLCKMGGRGFDIPRARLLIDASPTLSRTELEQRHSRITRKIRPGTLSSQGDFQKPFCIIAQVIPSSYPRPPMLFPDLLEGGVDLDGYKKMIDRSRSKTSSEIERIGNLGAAREDVRKSFETCKIALIDERDIQKESRDFSQIETADENGYIYIDGEKYSTLNNWSFVFEVALSNLKRRFKKVVPLKGIIQGTIRDFYSESDVRHLCGDYLDRKNLLQANDEDIILIGESKYRPFHYWVKKLGTNHPSLNKRLANTVGVKGLTKTSRTSMFYTQEQIDELPDFANAKGEIYIEGELYMNISDWARFYGVGPRYISTRIDESNYRLAHTNQGIERRFYPKSIIECVFSEIITDLPKANKQGFFEKEGVVYRTQSGWMHQFGFEHAIRSLNFDESQGIRGLFKVTQEITFYTEEVARVFCREFFEKKELPKANKDGFFIEDGVKYGTKSAWENAYNGRGKLGRANLNIGMSVDGRDVRGTERSFFSEEYIREMRPDLFD